MNKLTDTRRKKTVSLTLWFLLLPFLTGAQSMVHERSSTYIPPKEKEVQKKLADWQDLKFGILLHWGIYSVPGICESWTITSEDWITPDTTRTYEEYKQWYWGLINEFNPTQFDPEQWARVARQAGMKYAIFTTKHHDGFCLFDSKETDFTVTHSAFAGNPKQDAARYVFDAFRNEGMMMGAYFSKPDWHSPYYWWPSKATSNRSHNYSIKQYPERWKKYKSFDYNQISELMHGYGPIDILWLDGGWCTAPHEDIGLDSIVEMSRKVQPGLIVVERACPGKFENYQTPEQTIPDHQILNPWESCITLTNDWGWVPKPTFKSPATVLRMLSEIVAKGGSLVLGVGPTPQGLIEEEAVSRLQQIGKWLEANGEAIYGTLPTGIYTNEQKNVWFTTSKDRKTIYAIVPSQEGTFPSEVSWQGNLPEKGAKMQDLATGRRISYRVEGDRVTVSLPAKMTQGKDAIAISFPIRQPKWKLTWTEDFNKKVLDETVWSKTDRGTPDWQNTQSKDPRCFDFRNGCLILRGIVNDDLTKDSSPYLTGGVWTTGKFAFEPECRIEIRARLHRAQGAWPAFWLLPFDGNKHPWPHGGEIDIMERLNGDSIAYQTVHSKYTFLLKHSDYPRNGGQGPIDPDDFNVYGVDILEDSVSFSLNGKHTFSYPRIENEAENGQYPFMIPQFLLLDMQLGGEWVGKVNPDDLPVEMEIDWVRYYRKEE